MTTEDASPRDSRLRRRAARLARSPQGTALAAAWGFAEALSWPVLPEVALAGLCVADPRSGPRLSVAAAAGSVAGGLVTYALASKGVVPPQPLTTRRMRETVARQTREEGARAVRHQPLAGIPYKVYAARAGEEGVGALPFACASARARGTRIVTAGLALTAFGAAARSQRHRYGPYLAAAGTGFAAALTLIVRAWR
ncbi:membrane protein YqaA with SNARE-associated domain [Nocardiopsis mwathae]|uniref:Membrane protein YqaA with SNARE-associated domain n=1 Tax=Nocardiopsis mwathae TaxID=1472723 RepID=A0A7W9YEH8_9ACTN|nr:hypothetical protein [Nocardiopsis mwathae]MBB6170607.1 membrane protein YqaA with SNARE-associated domain [Nocardiopsis mwathae]